VDENSGIKDWGKLMAAGQYGNERAYRRLLGELHKWLTRWYRRRLPPALVDDGTQEALIAVHNKRNTYEPSRPFMPWLTSIVRHKWADQLRAAKRRKSDPLPDDLAVADHAGVVISASLLERLMAALKPAQAEVIRLVKLEGYSIAEASHRTGQSHPMVTRLKKFLCSAWPSFRAGCAPHRSKRIGAPMRRMSMGLSSNSIGEPGIRP
jgi:RNA polymerase sigma factor (sigma-70 family)